MNIYDLFYYTNNVYKSRRIGTRTKARESKGTYDGTRIKWTSGIQREYSKCKDFARCISSSIFFRFTSKQYSERSNSVSRKGKAWTQAKQVTNSLYFFFLYNPQILFTLIYIDSMFMDELISINIIQLQSMYNNMTDINLISNGGIG